MMNSRRTPPAQIAATLLVLVVGIGAAAIYIGRTTGGSVVNPAASSSASPSATATASQSTLAVCSPSKPASALKPLPGDEGMRTYAAAPPMSINTAHTYLVTMQTTRGVITMLLDPKLAPMTVNNFVFLARNCFYDGLTFHRVVAGFVIQGGDPQGTGGGGPGYQFADEPVKGEYTAGAVAMANSGPNTNGSQFFICTVDDRTALQKKYNLFGYVKSGMDVVLKIQQGDVMTSVAVQEQQ